MSAIHGDMTGTRVDSATRAAKTAAVRSRCRRTRKMVLCPGCGANIVRQVVEEELEPGFIEYSVQAIGQSFRSVFKGWGPYLKKRSIRRAAGVALALCVLLVLSLAIQRSKEFPGGLFHRKIDVTFNVPAPGDDLSSGKEGERLPEESDTGRTSMPPRNSRRRRSASIRLSSRTAAGATTSDITVVMGGSSSSCFPDGRGGAYEQELQGLRYPVDQEDSKSPPGDVKIYGIN